MADKYAERIAKLTKERAKTKKRTKVSPPINSPRTAHPADARMTKSKRSDARTAHGHQVHGVQSLQMRKKPSGPQSGPMTTEQGAKALHKLDGKLGGSGAKSKQGAKAKTPSKKKTYPTGAGGAGDVFMPNKTPQRSGGSPGLSKQLPKARTPKKNQPKADVASLFQQSEPQGSPTKQDKADAYAARQTRKINRERDQTD